ncbi:UNKNOWN [Stylonychia lemnae]|uniref:Thioesterase domain-containing protein n=1 Tax=Stylonychia lemnae TaxID=5949 RepID=A0A078AGB2_STYLE|nr:UNKNOWN [Stylonychia lemnae]|eukprot:CDW81274.1 UNKNOWN [Stylonychia lemnae]
MTTSSDKQTVTTITNQVFEREHVYDSTKFLQEIMRNQPGQEDMNEYKYNKNITFLDTKFLDGIIAKSFFKMEVTPDMKDDKGCLLRTCIGEILDFIPMRVSDGAEFRRKMTLKLAIEYVHQIPIKKYVVIEGKVIKIEEKSGLAEGKIWDPDTKQIIAKCQIIFVFIDQNPKL